MKHLFHSVLSLLLVAVMNLFVLGAFSSALSMSSAASMPGMNHTKISINCATLCASAMSNKRSDVAIIDNENDDEPNEPFYIVNQQSLHGVKAAHAAVARAAVKFEPPPGLPGYIRFSVFRT